jgi:hypothetical protein
MDSVAQAPLYMNVSPLILGNNDLTALRMITDSYLESLLRLDISPEHSSGNSAALEKLREMFVQMRGEGCDVVLFMTEPDVIALDEAIEGYIRIFKCSQLSARKKRPVIECLKRSREGLTEMKLALTNCKQHDVQTCGVTEYMGRKCYCTQIRRGPVGGCQQVLQHCTTLWPGMLEWLQANVEGGL